MTSIIYSEKFLFTRCKVTEQPSVREAIYCICMYMPDKTGVYVETRYSEVPSNEITLFPLHNHVYLYM